MSEGSLGRRKTAAIAIGILLLAAAIVAFIFFTEPEAKREAAVKESAMRVEVKPAEGGAFRPTIVAMGLVRPVRDVVLEPRIAGEVVERAPGFQPGGFVEGGELLLRIEPADYENALAQARSTLLDAEAQLALEMGQQEVARAELSLVGTEIPESEQALVLRRPQLQAAEARVAAARAAVEQAELALSRTRIRAPFDAHVISRDVSLGSQVGPGNPLGRLVGLDRWWVEATVPVSTLPWLALPESEGGRGAVATVRDRSAWPEGVERQGELESVVRAVDSQARMARVLVAVHDPLGRDPATTGPPLLVGAWVEVRLEGEEIRDVVRLELDLLRKDDTAWVMEDGQLQVRELDLAFKDADFAYIRSGVAAGEAVVTTDLSTVTDGAPLRLKEQPPAEAAP